MKRGYFHSDPDELRVLGLISDEMYYQMKRREAAFNCDVKEQKKWMRLEILDRRQKQKEEEEKRKEQEKIIEDVIEKELTKEIKKALS
jgi:hypothetical protein